MWTSYYIPPCHGIQAGTRMTRDRHPEVVEVVGIRSAGIRQYPPCMHVMVVHEWGGPDPWHPNHIIDCDRCVYDTSKEYNYVD